MSSRKVEFVTGEYYHIYNRGVDLRNIIQDKYDPMRFVECLYEFNSVDSIGSIYLKSFEKHQLSGRAAKLVSIIAYCVNPNHFHLLLKQEVDGGIQKFMHKFGGYSLYFNIKYNRTGSLFQGKFKAKHVKNNDYFLYLSAYINLNNRVHKISGPDALLVRSSWREYTEGLDGLADKEDVMAQFESPEAYRLFAEDSLISMWEAKEIQKELKALRCEE